MAQVNKKKILLLGSAGKLGTALKNIFQRDYYITGKNSCDFNALFPEQIRDLIEDNKPDIVINTVALVGIDNCEKEPEKAFKLNTVLPKILAELSNEKGFLLIHFSTDAVFNNDKRDFRTETDCPKPLNLYGVTKYGGDCLIQAIAEKYYIFRTSVLFGEMNKNTQFVEKMLKKIREGQKVLRISSNIICSPTYSNDIAKEVKRILETPHLFGLYHIANAGMASLCDLMKAVVENLNLKVKVEKASYMDFPSKALRNTFTPIRSEKIKPIRPWEESVKEYCNGINI